MNKGALVNCRLEDGTRLGDILRRLDVIEREFDEATKVGRVDDYYLNVEKIGLISKILTYLRGANHKVRLYFKEQDPVDCHLNPSSKESLPSIAGAYGARSILVNGAYHNIYDINIIN